MPTYEYRCHSGHRFEEFQSMLAEPIQVCPVCGDRAERLISGGTGLIFKGSGFYITDYVKKGDGKGDKPAVPETKPTATETPSVSSSAPKSESSPSATPKKSE
ncbi:zinc ribbon domain-containing protein [bacterium]|nr:zinc ribbon domain-containing protein [bacterium]MBU1983500.1 zinc ribbon domain-containing protein [bacterium]